MQQSDKEIYIALILATCIIIVFVAGILIFVLQYRKRKIQFQLEKKTMELHHTNNLKEATLQMQQLTMQDIGREIHDGVGQRLTLASIYSKQLINKNFPVESKQKIEEISSIINESLEQLRMLSKELANEQEHHVDIIKLISYEVEKVNALEVCKVNFKQQQVLYLENKKAKFIVRIIQEFLQNSLKYANCTLINASISNQNDLLILQLNDNGIGFDTTKSSNGIGLQNMKRRAEMIGAKLEINSSNVGTSLNLKLPLL